MAVAPGPLDARIVSIMQMEIFADICAEVKPIESTTIVLVGGQRRIRR